MKKHKLFVLLGPTSVGKTQCSLELAKHLNSPIINADSRQIFRELPIGTAAPTSEEQQDVQHYFVGSNSIHDYYSAAIYEEEALKIINNEFKTHDALLLSGGSMMYIDAVCKGIDDIPTINNKIRELLKNRFEQEGLEPLLAELKKLDPVHYDIVDKKNYRRVMHALEVCLQTGKTYTSFRKNSVKKRPFEIIKIGLTLPREEMYERINARVLAMVENGLLEEVKSVYPFKHLTSLNTVGYKELFEYLDNQIDYAETIRRIQSNTRQYMRKQMTWFKRDQDIKWFSPFNTKEIIKYIDSVL